MSEGGAILDTSTGVCLLGFFSVAWILLGAYWGRQSKSLDGHMLAGRQVGLALGSATAVATWVTSNTTMLAPQFALQMGIWGMLAYSSAAIGLFFFAPMAGRIRKLMPYGYTSAEFMRLRYGRGAWFIFLTISIFYALTWMISMGIAGGLLLESLSGIPYQWGMTVILFVCTCYTVMGGLKAVIGTDFIQSFIILVGVAVIGVAVVLKVPLAEIYQEVQTERPALLQLFLPVAVMALFNNLLFGMGEIFHSNVWWSRAFAFREGIGVKAYLIAGFLWLPIPIAAGFIALAAPSLGVNVPQINMVGPLVAGKLLGATGAIVVFIVVFSSIASSIDSLLAATADLITNDLVKGVFWKSASEKQLMRCMTGSIFLLSLITWVVCRIENPDLATVLFRAGPLVGSAIWPILAGLYWSRTNPLGVSCAMILGSILGLVAYYTLGWYTAAVVGTAVSMIITIGTTLIWPKPFSWQQLRGTVGAGANG